ncbi:MAG TPA: DNA cytosine methyltransferase [Solirubrobacterales bacterium]|jgi:DNA (cytosine-5)-methyltransferase 1
MAKSAIEAAPDRDRPTVLSLFAGASGLDLGFSAAGFETLAFVELEPWACDTLRENHPKASVVGPPDHSGDVRDLTKASLGKLCEDATSPDVVIGGPPCQPYSIAAAQRFLRGDERFKRTGHADRRRGGLFREFFRVVRETEPRAFLLENVPGLLELDQGEAMAEMIEDLKGLGYRVAEPKVLEAADFGVPQLRQRVFIIGAMDAQPALPEPTYGPNSRGKRKWLTVAHALAGMPTELANHAPRKHEPRSIARYRKLAFGQREHLGRVDRLDPRRPSKTVIAGGSGGGGRSHLHPFIARTLTVRECARLQTFPDDFEFYGSSARQFTQVGNAVPPLLAEQLARSLGTALGLDYGKKQLRHGRYLRRRTSLDELTRQLVEESRIQRPGWLYEDIDSVELAVA